MAEVTYISYSARAKSTTADGIFAEAHQILDVSKNKNQQAINAEVTTELGKKVAKSDFDSFKTSNTSAIAAKADKSYVYTELGTKANSADVYTKSQVYTKGETDTKLAEKATTASVNSLTTRVTAVETKASTNASNITNLTSRVGAVESKFSGYVPTATYNALAARVAELEALLKLA